MQLHRVVGAFLLVVLYAAPQQLHAQRRRTEDGAVWYSQSLNVPLPKKWSFTEDGSVRWYGLHRNVSVVTLRGHLERKLGGDWAIGAGYAFFEQFRDREGWYESRQEQRPHLQLTGRRKWGIWQWSHRGRVEERFLTERSPDGERFYSHFTRLRFMTALQLFPFKKGGWTKCYAIAQAEVMLHAGEPRFVRQTFDQLRIYPHVGYAWSTWLDLQAGYMFYYQIHPANTQEVLGHVLRFSALFRLPKKG